MVSRFYCQSDEDIINLSKFKGVGDDWFFFKKTSW